MTEAQVIKNIMLLSHERGVEITVDEVLRRAEKLSGHLCHKGLPGNRMYALELMFQLLSEPHGT